MGAKIIDCHATPTKIALFFSNAVDQKAAEDKKNYNIANLTTNAAASFPPDDVNYQAGQNAAFLSVAAANKLKTGDWISISAPHLGLDAGGDVFATRVNGDDFVERNIGRTTRAVEDAVSFPVLTEDVGFARSPVTSSPAATPSAAGGTALGAVVAKAVGDVLGWKVKTDDVKGFVGALNASFTGQSVDGRIDYSWTPRTYAVQTDLSGGITGAQASLYTRAKEALDKSIPLLEGLYPLDPEADAEDTAALKAVAQSQLTELVGELGYSGGPRISRVNQYFVMLLGANIFSPTASAPLQSDPDTIGGTLGNLRDELGLSFTKQDFVNTLQDEQDVSNYRILSDYVTSLAQSWINNLPFFGLDTQTPFFGTQLVLLSRQLSEVSETVDEVRFTLDSVFIGPAERQTLRLNLGPNAPPLFIEDLLTWIQGFATTEGPQLIQDGGKLAVQNSFLPIIQQLRSFVVAAHDRSLNHGLPRGFHTSRVQRALEELRDGLEGLETLAKNIRHAALVEPTAAQLNATQQQVAILTSEVTTLLQPRLVALPSTVATAGGTITGNTTLFNNSDLSSLTIKSIPNHAGEFTIGVPVNLPTTLGPAESLVISVTSGAGTKAAGPKSSDLLINWTITGTDTQPPVTVHLTG